MASRKYPSENKAKLEKRRTMRRAAAQLELKRLSPDTSDGNRSNLYKMAMLMDVANSPVASMERKSLRYRR